MRYSEIRCYGGSMDFFFASGARLIVDSAGKSGQGGIRAGDIVAYLDWAGSPLISVHRVFFRFRTRDGDIRFLTKGDANLWFDPVVSGAQIIGKVVGIVRDDGSAAAIDSLRGWSAGLVVSVYSYFAVFVIRVCEAALLFLQFLICRIGSAASLSAGFFQEAGRSLPPLLWLGNFADPNRYCLLYSLASWLPRRVLSAALIRDSRFGPAAVKGNEAGPGTMAANLAGKIAGKLILGGEVTICGDVTILPGASLLFQPGTRIVFAPAKSVNSRVMRNTEKGLQDFGNEKLCKIIVYGELTCAGRPGARISFGGGAWDSLIFLGSSRGVFESVSFSGSANPLRTMDFSRVALMNVDPSGIAGKEFCVSHGCSAVKVSDVLFRGIAFPLAAHDSARLTVWNCEFENPVAAIHVRDRSRCRISHCGFSGFSGYACHASGGASLFALQCAYASGSVSFFGEGKSAIRLRKVNMERTSGPAIRFKGRAVRSRLADTKIAECRRGIHASGAYVSGENIVVRDCLGPAIHLEHRADFRGTGGEICGNGTEAVRLDPGSRLSLHGTKIEASREGIHASGAQVSLAGIVISGCSGRGIYLENAAALHCSGGEIAGGVQAVCSESGSEFSIYATKITGNSRGISAENAKSRLQGVQFRDNGEFSVCLNGGTHKITDCSVEAGKTGVGVYKGAECVIDNILVSGTTAEALDITSARVHIAKSAVKYCACGVKAAGRARVVASALVCEGIKYSAIEVHDKSALHLDGGSLSRCGCGLKAVGGSSVSTAELACFGIDSNGVELHTGSGIRMKGGKISRCGGCAVISEGSSAVFLDSTIVELCGNGLAAAGGGTSRLRKCEITDIAGACISSSGGDLDAEHLILLRAASGFSVHSGADADIYGTQIGLTGVGVEAAGRSSVSLRNSGLRGCSKGLWIQDGSAGTVSDCLFERSVFAGVYTDGGRCHVKKTFFGENTIGVFTDHCGLMELSEARFVYNKTGVKNDNSSRISIKASLFRGCAWDGIWCGGNSETKLNGNNFVLNRYAIKEDGPCALRMSGNMFFRSGVCDHLAWPHSRV